MKIRKFLKEKKSYLMGGVVTVAVSLPTVAFAESTVASTITASFQQVVTDTLASIAAIAPIGITVFAAMFCWKQAKKFFATVAK